VEVMNGESSDDGTGDPMSGIIIIIIIIIMRRREGE